MPTKKKKSGRGKAKKAAGSSKQKEEQQASHDTQLGQQKIGGGDNSQPYDEDSFLEEAIKLAAAEKEALESGAGEKKESTKLKRKIIRPWQCHHGYVVGGDHFIIDDFCKIFWSRLKLLGERKFMRAAYSAVHEKYPEILCDDQKLKLVKSFYLYQGTHCVLEGHLEASRAFAFLAIDVENFIDTVRETDDGASKEESKVTKDARKHIEMLRADDHTLVKYLRKNIPCSCLDKKYKEVKSIAKMGVCCNLECSLPNRMTKRSTMLCCDGCRRVNYCSRECQKAAWPEHKKICGDNFHKMEAELESRDLDLWSEADKLNHLIAQRNILGVN